MGKEELKKLKELVDHSIEHLALPKKPAGLYEPVDYVLKGGGKRLRPLLLLAFAKSLGADPKQYVNQAVALEMYHNFTLLHDDVMDKADMRHGRPTVHKKWDVATAILSGDVMLSLSSSMMMSNLKGEKACQAMMVFNDTQIKIDEGQQMDMNFETADNVSLNDYEEMIMLKTGALFGCACALGVLMAQPEGTKGFGVLFKNAVKFGFMLGVAFQLQDDLLDTYGDEHTFGKQIGGDIVNNKKTWLLISALNSNKGKKLRTLLDNPSLSRSDKIQQVTEIYDSLGLKDKLEQRIADHLNNVNKLITEMSPAVGEEGAFLLKCFVGRIMGREK